MTSDETINSSPWKTSQSGSIYCRWKNLPDDIKAQLDQQDGFERLIEGSRYTVRKDRFNEGDYVVFTEPIDQHVTDKKQNNISSVPSRITEVQAVSLEDANKLLSMNNQYELIGTDPVKVLKDQLFALVGKKEDTK